MDTKKGWRGRRKTAMWLVGLATPVAGLQAGVTNYTYDELGRLVRVSDTRNGDRTYAYDAAGNRTQVIVGEQRIRDGRERRFADAGPAEKVYSASNASSVDEVSPSVAMNPESGISDPAGDPKASEPEARPVNVR